MTVGIFGASLAATLGGRFGEVLTQADGNEPAGSRCLVVLCDDAHVSHLLGKLQSFCGQCEVVLWRQSSDDFASHSASFAFLLIQHSIGEEVLSRLASANSQSARISVLGPSDFGTAGRAFASGFDEYVPANEMERIPTALLAARRNASRRVRFIELRQAYAEQKERFDDVLELSSDWLWEQNHRYAFSFVTPLVRSGIDPVDVLGKTRCELAGADIESPKWAEHLAMLERHEPFHDFVYSNVVEDGRTAWFSISGKPVFNRDGSFRGYRGTGREITDDYLRAERLRESEERFAYAVRGSTAGIWDWKVPEESYYMSPRFKEILGYTDEELPNDRASFLHCLHPDDVSTVHKAVHDHFKEHLAYDIQYRMIGKDGTTIWCQAIGQAVWDTNGEVVRFAGSTSNVTAQKEAEARVRSLIQQQEAILESAPVGIAFLKEGRVVRCNQTLCSKLGTRREALQGAGLSDHARQRGLADIEALVMAVTHSRDVLAGEVQIHDEASGDMWMQYKSSPLDRDDATAGHVLVTLDITERKRAEQKLLHLAQHDGLTDLPNRVLFRNILVQTLAQARRREWLAGVLFIDLDRFKHVNDSLGHSAGDRLLRMIAERIRQCLRASDTVARLGGDEFGVILPDLAGAEDAVTAAKKILGVLNGPVQLGPRDVSIAGSIGIALFPSDGPDPDALIANADAAMYQAKALGRSQYQFFTPELNIRATRFLELETKLRQAIARNQLELHYQPKASVASGNITGVEALLRWRIEPGRYMAPVEFIPVLEETGLIVEVGEWVIREACEQLHRWCANGVKDITMAVNVAARQVSQTPFAERVIPLVKAAGIRPEQFEIEITESAVMQDLEACIVQLAHLQASGISVALDDFGTGYSSLSYLKRLDVETLKLDRSFMSDVVLGGHDATLASAIIAMARQLKIKVIAEGVETREQLDFLRARRCDEYQGYLLSRPMPGDAVFALLPKLG